jgi:hypothetical protein
MQSSAFVPRKEWLGTRCECMPVKWSRPLEAHGRTSSRTDATSSTPRAFLAVHLGANGVGIPLES